MLDVCALAARAPKYFAMSRPQGALSGGVSNDQRRVDGPSTLASGVGLQLGVQVVITSHSARSDEPPALIQAAKPVELLSAHTRSTPMKRIRSC